MSKPSKISTGYADDRKMMDYCKSNPNDEECDCILLTDPVTKASSSTSLPYYCWYSPCLSNNNYVTYLIKKEQELCNRINCVIKLGDILVEKGSFDVSNHCSQSSMDSYFVEDVFEKTYTSDIKNILPPNYSHICIFGVFLTIILLI